MARHRAARGVCALAWWVLAGCAPSGASPLSPTALPLSPDSTTNMRSSTPTTLSRQNIADALRVRGPVLYVSDEEYHTVFGFEQSDPSAGPFIQLADVVGPMGLYVDSEHNLWVADSGRNAIAVYRRGESRASRLLNDPNGADDVTICPNGTVFASGGNIVAYDRDAREPTRTLADPLIFFEMVTCDAANNVIASGYANSGPSEVDVFVGGVQSGLKSLPINPGIAGGVLALPSGTFLLAEPVGSSSGGGEIIEFTEDGHATGKVLVTAYDIPWGIGLGKGGQHLFLANWQGPTAEEFSWRTGQHLASYTIPNSFPQAWGLAVDPPLNAFQAQ